MKFNVTYIEFDLDDDYEVSKDEFLESGKGTTQR